jgi:sugar phosphate isomerase/epimerase
VLSTLGQAVDLCDGLGEGSGIALDVYHVWWDPDLARQMALRRGRIAAFHACDWLCPPPTSSSTGACPGDGVIDIAAIRAMAEAAGYAVASPRLRAAVPPLVGRGIRRVLRDEGGHAQLSARQSEGQTT